MTDTLFNTDQGNQTQSENRDYFAELTGPGGKFDKSKYSSEAEMYQAIAKGKVLADETVAFKNNEFDQLKQDYLAAREQLNTRASVEELTDRLLERQTNRTNTQADVVQTPTVAPDEIAKIVSKQLQQAEFEKKQRENFALVQKRLAEELGENYPSVLKSRVDALGITPEQANDLAKNSPNVLLKAIGVDQPKSSTTFQAPPRSQVRSDQFAPKTETRNYAYYEKLRKEKPEVYLDPAVQVQRMKDAEIMREAFFE